MNQLYHSDVIALAVFNESSIARAKCVASSVHVRTVSVLPSRNSRVMELS